MAIYTRKGDDSNTSIYSSPKKDLRLSKSDVRIEAIGAVDELNSYIGVVCCHLSSKHTKEVMFEIQKVLFEVGAILAGADITLDGKIVEVIEKEIDEIDATLPPLRNFLVSSGSLSAVSAMYLRSIARKAERRVAALSKYEKLPQTLLSFVNRLSDYFFIVFRDENRAAGVSEEMWVGKKPSN